MRVLLVEDHADTRELFVTILSSQGFTVDTAITGLQAVDRATADPPDVIVLDLELPGVDGWAVARHIRGNSLTCETPIVAFTAHAFAEDEARAHAAGCDEFVAKPCTPMDLFAAIDRARDRRKRRRDDAAS
jgi:two-component system cell cycle response regulator DivK